MKAKFTRRVFTFAVPRVVKSVERVKQTGEDGVERDLDVESERIEIDQRAVEIHCVHGGPDPAQIQESEAINLGLQQFGGAAKLIAVQDVVTLVEVPSPGV